MKSREFIIESESDHGRALQQTGFWGRAGAGCIIFAVDTGRFCIAHRSKHVEQPGTWGTWGGAIDATEDPSVAATRELREESGYSGKLKLVPLFVFKHKSGFRYHNFLAIVPREFTPTLDWETQGYEWVEYGNWPKPMHAGLLALLSDSTSNNTLSQVVEKYSPNQQHLGEGSELTSSTPMVGHLKKLADHLHRINALPQDDTLKDYTGHLSNSVNDLLHMAIRGNNIDKARYVQALHGIHKLDAALEKGRIKEDMMVYSGLIESPARAWEVYKRDPAMPIRVNLPAYTSTTTDFDTATSFASSDEFSPRVHPIINAPELNLHFDLFGPHILEIHIPKGLAAGSVKRFSLHKDEDEFILQRGLNIEISPNPILFKDSYVWEAKVVGISPVKVGKKLA